MVISENAVEHTYKVFPSTAIVIGFQYSGQLASIAIDGENKLSSAGITGIADRVNIFKNTAAIGTVLVYFTETGFAHFCACPAHELFNQSISLDDIFAKDAVVAVEEALALSCTDQQRIKAVETFLIRQLKEKDADRLVERAVQLIYNSKGNIKMASLQGELYISASAFEKRFRKLVGASPKKIATIVRFNAVLRDIDKQKSLTEICYGNNFFDQAHFIRDFRQFTGSTPDNFRRAT